MRWLVYFASISIGVAGLVAGCSLSNLDDYKTNAGGAAGASGGAPSGGGSSGGKGGSSGNGGSGGSSSGGVTGGGGSASGGAGGASGAGGATQLVACGSLSCVIASSRCCITKDSTGKYDAKCWDAALACTGIDVTCDGPEDCSGSEQCCAVMGVSELAHIRCQTSCDLTKDFLVCGSNPGVCPSGSCVPAGQFPEYNLCN